MLKACKDRLRIYVAGAYSADNVMTVFDNMRRGQHVGYYVVKAGMAPFVPWIDYHFGLIGPMEIHEYYEYSIAFERTCDAILVIEELLENSKGTHRELEIARNEMKIPEFYVSAEKLMLGKMSSEAGWMRLLSWKKVAEKYGVGSPEAQRYINTDREIPSLETSKVTSIN